MSPDVIPDVVLLHGLWMPGIVMSPLASRLADQGFRTHVFDYASRKKPIAAHAERLARFARDVGGGAPVHFVGHSLGGLVVLAALAGPNPPPVASTVLLGTPAQGCMAGRRLGQVAPGRWMLGESAPLWKEGRVSQWDRRAPLGVIAGSVPIGLARALGRLPGVNDGVVRLEETEVEGMAERIVLPVGHTELIFSARVAAQTAQFLRHGRFSHEA
jgi:pimeloyl-ACP methyl ester carboxylesterase